MKKLFNLIPLFLLVSGCATVSSIPKPEMNQQEYTERAMRYAHFGTCLRLGYMDSSTYGKAMYIGEGGANAVYSNINTQKLDEMTRVAEKYIFEDVRSMSNEKRNEFKYECQMLSGITETNYSQFKIKLL